MKTMNFTIQRNIVITMTVILAVLLGTVQVAAVEYKNSYQPSVRGQQISGYQGAAPVATFQSTSALPGSGSTYSATPMLNEDGTATYNGVTGPYNAPAGPRKNTIGNPDEEDEDKNPNPLGDAVLPLMLLALAYAGMRLFRKKRARTLE